MIHLEINGHHFSVDRRGVGALCIWYGASDVEKSSVAFHLLPFDKKDQFWGFNHSWYDGPLTDIGFGRIAIVAMTGYFSTLFWKDDE